MDTFLESFLYGAIGAFIFYVIWVLFSKQRVCPKCKTELPPFRAPANKRQILWGGWTCPKCGAQIDRKGNLIKKAK